MRRNIRVKNPRWEEGWAIFDRSSGGYEETPRLGNGEMYVSTAYPNHVFALDPGNPGRITSATSAERDPKTCSVACCWPTEARPVGRATANAILHTFGRAIVGPRRWSKRSRQLA
jgi:hypothetical protein